LIVELILLISVLIVPMSAAIMMVLATGTASFTLGSLAEHHQVLLTEFPV
jgi:hypothetical protein